MNTYNHPYLDQRFLSMAQRAAAIEVSLDGIAVLENGRFIDVNPSHAKMFGYSIDEMLGKPWHLLYAPNQSKQFQEIVFPMLDQVGHWRGEMIATRKDGSTFDQEVSLSLLENGQLVCICRDISDRKRTTEALAKSEEQFRSLVEEAGDIIYSFNLQGIFTYVSPQIEALTGHQPSDLINHSCNLFIHPEDVDLMVADLQKLLQTGAKQQGLELRVPKKNGEWCWIVFNNSPIKDASGQIVGIQGIGRDATAQKAAQRERQRQEEALRAIVEGTAGKTGSDFYRACTQYLAEIFDVRYAFLTKLIDQSYTQSQFISLWAGGQFIEPYVMKLAGTPCLATFQNDWGIFPKDLLSYFPTSSTLASLKGESYLSVVIRDFSGNILGNLGVIDTKPLSEDIPSLQFILKLFAHRVAAEMVRQADEDNLRKRQQQMQMFIDNSPAVMYLKDLQGHYQIINQTFVNLFALESESLLGKTDYDIFPATIAQQLCDKDQQIIESGTAHTIEETITHPNGSEHTYVATKFVLNDKYGQPYALGGVSTDITDRKQTEKQLNQTNQRLELTIQELMQATRHKDEFLATMSHELRTPLNAILGMSEALLEQLLGELNERQTKSLSTIERSGRHLLALINDILDVSKISAGKLELDIAEVSVEALCNSSLSLIKQQAFDKKIQLNVQISPDMHKIAVDERRIRQVLINLLSNAVKFTPNGGQITLRVFRGEDFLAGQGWIEFAVKDTGIGIAEADRDKLFQPFVQLDSTLNRQYAGTGLGLTLVKQIVELHSGRISFQSKLGQGSCFTVQLPESCWIDNFKDEKEPPLDSCNERDSDMMKSPLILLAEDNEANIDTFTSYLTAKGYRTISAENGHQAVELAQREHPDLILMDIQMPEMDGLEAITHIRQIPHLKSLPIIALTALAMAGDREKCLAVGASDYLTKPVPLKQLSQRIQQWLE